MTVPWRRPVRHAFLRSARAEFLKIWASRVPLVFLLAIPVGCYLVVFELYHVEHIREEMHVRHALHALPALFFGVWRMMLFQAAVLAFAAFWATIDSQYGMIRVASTQPLSRVEYLLSKWLGISVHLALVTAALILSLVGWAALYSGLHGIGAPEIGMLLRFSFELLALTLAFGGVGMATASFRRTVASGMVTAMLAFIGLAVMTMLPFDVFPPRFVFVRYFFFPMQEFPSPFLGGDNPFVRMYSISDFYVVALATPLVFWIPAILYFRHRDISE
jgi:ABC-type transport system involved in multi-copper enzyme maturation permease subunit